MLLPPRLCGLIKKSDLKDASLAGDPKSIMRTGLLGMIDRFAIYATNLLPAASDPAGAYCYFGHREATSFATQMVESKVLDNPNGFGMLHRHLQVFGYKVVHPEALGVLIAKVG